MRYILLILFFYVTIIHFMVRGIMVFFADLRGDLPLRYFRMNKTEQGYYGWELPQVLTTYSIPYIVLLLNFGSSPVFVCCVLCAIIALLRSLEHIYPKFLD